MGISTTAQRLAGLLISGLLSVSGISGASAATINFEADIVAVGGLLQPITTLTNIKMEWQGWPKKVLIWGGLEPSMLPW